MIITPVTTSSRNHAIAARLLRTGISRHMRSMLGVVVCLVFLSEFAQAQVAANFGWGFTPVGSGFSIPAGVAIDSVGDVFVADSGNHSVKEIVAVGGVVSASSTVVTISSAFTDPVAMAFDSAGDLFVVDSGTLSLYEIQAAGGVVSSSSTVVTITNTLVQPVSVALDKAGDVFVANASYSTPLQEVVAVAGVVSSTSAVDSIGLFLVPEGVVADSAGDIFVNGSSAIAELTAVNGTVSPSSTPNFVAEGGAFNGAVALDSSGDVFTVNNLLSSSSVAEVLASGGAVNNGSQVISIGSGLNYPQGVAVDGRGNIYVADTENNRVVELQPNGVDFGSLPVATSTPTTLTLTFTFVNGGSINAPAVLTQGTSSLDFTDAGTGSCTTNGTSQYYEAGDTCTVDVTFNPTVPGVRYGAVSLSSFEGTLATGYVYGTGVGPQVTFSPGTGSTVGSGFSAPQGVAVDSAGDVFIADSANNAVKEIVAVSGLVSSNSTVNTVGSGFTDPTGVAVDGAGNFFVADRGSNSVKEIVAANGAVTSSSPVITVGSGFYHPTGVAVDGSGDVFVADRGNSAVKEIVAVGGVVSSSSTVNTVGSGFSNPYGVAVDDYGNVFVADDNHNAVKEIVAVDGAVSSSSTVVTVGSGFSTPYGVAVDGNGDVFVADQSHNAVKEIIAVSGAVSSSSTVKTLGSGFGTPAGVAVAASGNVFVGDTGNNAVKEIDLADAPSLTFPNTPVYTPTSPQTVTLLNSGNAPLTFEVPLGPTNPAVAYGFELDGSSTCPQLTNSSSAVTLAAGASCTEAIDFNPSSGGQFSGSVTTTDNALNATSPNYATQSISVSGYGLVSPTIGAINPSIGVTLGGTTVSISGNGFTGVTSVHFGGIAASSFTVNNDSSITAVSPPSGTPTSGSTVDIVVSNPAGNSPTNSSDQFTYQPPPGPDMYSVTPSTGSAGTIITLFGANFTGASIVYIGEAQATSFTIINDSTITAVVPPKPPGEGGGGNGGYLEAVTVTTPYGTSYPGNGNFFTYISPPTVTSVSPSSGPTTGATSVTITGSGFTGATGVSFGSVAATSFTVNSDTSVTATSPAQATGTVDVTVNVDGAISATSSADQYTYGSSSLSEPVGTASATQTATVTVTTGGTVASISVLTQGAANLDFQLASGGTCTTTEYDSTQTCTVNYTFTPSRPGVRYGAVVLSDASGNPLATAYLSGIGTGPQVAFGPGTTNTIASGFNSPQAVAVDAAGDVFVADTANNAVKEIVAVNGVVSASSPVNTVGGGFSSPHSVAVDAAGNVFVGDYGNNAVKEIVAANGAVSSSSTVITVGTGFSAPTGVAVDGSGNVFVADSGNNVVKEIVAVDGAVSASSAVNTIGSGFNYPYGVSVDSFGDVFVADTYHSAVKEIVAVNGVVSSSSTVITIGSGFYNPSGVAVDGFGNVFVADINHSAVKEILAVNGVVSSSSTVITIGSGFTYPYGVAVDGRGNVFVADQGNHAVKEIDVADAPSLSFASTAVGSTSSDSPKTVTITNNGNAPLTFEVPSTGLNPNISTGFTYSNSSTCAQLSTTSSAATLAAGASCTELVSFTPTASGSITGSLVTTDNTLNAAGPNYATQTTALSGTATDSPAPTVSSVSPMTGPTSGGTSVTITGTNLGSATSVHFGANAATIVSNTATQIVATSPVGSNGLVDVTVTTANGTSATSSSDAFLYFVNAPTISNVSPRTGVFAGGTSVTITGSNFTTTTAIEFGSVNAPNFTVNSDTSITVITPACSCGTVDITITNLGGPSTHNSADQFSFVPPPPVVTGISPTSGSTAGGTTVTITGTDLGSLIGVSFGGNAATVVSRPANEIVVTSPAGSAGTVDVTVTTANGTSATSSADQFTYVAASAAPAVTGISPTTGSTAGGTSVTITGTNLANATGVSFGSNAATIVSDTATQIVATSPAGVAGTVDVTVTTAGGTSAMSASDQFTYSAPNNYTAPSEPVGMAGTTQTAYINITMAGTTNATLGTAIQVLTQGVAGLDFAYVTGGTCATSTAYTVGQVCSVEYSFTPEFPGTRMGGIALYSNASTPVLLGSTYISGTGTGPESLFSSPIQATLGTGFNGAFDLALDGAGNLYVPNQGTQSIIKIAAGTNTQTTVATGGVYTSVALDGLGNMYAANLANKTIVEFIGGTGTPVTIASGLTYPDLGMAVDAQGNVYEPDTGTNVIVKVAAGTHTVTRFGSGLDHPIGVSLDASGNMYISDSNNNRIVEITADGATQRTVATLSKPAQSAFDAAGNLYVAQTNGSIGKLAAGTFNYSQLAGGYNAPFGLALTADGTLYMSDVATNVITTFDRTSSPTLSFASTNDGSSSAQQTVALENDGNATLYFVIPGAGVTNPTTPHDFTFTTAGGTACPSLTSSASAEGALAAGATCTVPITFTPVSPSNGALSESLVFTDTNLNAAAATQSITLTGTAALVAPTVTGVSPNSGATAGGAVVTITGTGFTGSFAVMFGSSAASSFTVVSATTLTAVSPVGSGTVDVTVTTGGGTSAVSPADHFTYVPPPTATQAIASKALTQNHAATAFTPVTGSGGASPLSYSVSPMLPTGLSFATSTGTITGTPSAAHTATMYTVTVTDANGATGTANFSLTVNSAVAATTAVASTVLTQNHEATAFTPVTGSGGTTPLTYSISPALPAGLSLASATGTISGTPTAVSGETTYTVTVTDANGATSTETFSLTVNAAVTATTAVASKVLTQNHAAAAFTPVTGSGGTAPLTYNISPALPAGLSLASATGTISGTPTAVSAATTYTVTVTDANGATTTATFSLTVNAVVAATTAVASTVLTQSHAAAAFTPVTGSGGTTPLTYSVSPALPAGLSLSSTTGVISGTPTVVSAAATYTVTVTDANGATSTSTFSLTVNAAVAATTAAASTVLTQNHAAAAFTPVTGSGGTGTLTYSVSPALPSGLSFSSTTGTVSGTPTVVSVATTYTVTVTDADGATSTATFSLTVNVALSATTALSSTVLIQGHAATAFTPITATGGTGALTYTVSPALPAGLSLSSTTGTISGTPTVVSAAATYTVTVTDANGATATATFSLTVNAPATTSTALTSSSLTPTYGAAVVLTATVTPAPTDTPPGTANFYTGSTLLGTSALNTAGVATLSIALPLGANSITAVYSGSASYAGSTSSALSVSDRAVSSLTVSANPTTQLYNNPIVLTAQAASSTVGSLTGSVSFLDGTTVLATVPLGANGQASYSIATLADGSHSLTATYSGDTNFQPSGSTGAAVAITVGDLNLDLGNDKNQSVVPGAVVSYNFPLSPLVTPTFLYDVHLTATGLPPGATYSFSPSVIPAGSASLPVTLTVQTAKGTASLSMPTGPGQQNSSRGLTALAFGLLLPLLGAKRVRKRLKAMPRPLAVLLFTALSLGAMVGMTGCGGGGFYGPTATSGQYTITVTATSADLVRVSTVQLTIQ